MAINFPSSTDSLTNPSSSDYLNNPDHAAQHANANDILEALEAKVGVDSSEVTTSHDYMIAKLKKCSGILGTRDRTTADGSVNYAHGLGVIPRFVKITALTDTALQVMSVGTFDGTNHKCIYNDNGGGSSTTAETSTTYIVYVKTDSGNYNRATCSVDATNVTLAWTKGGTPAAGDIQILIECLG
jgi:hypothetical protein